MVLFVRKVGSNPYSKPARAYGLGFVSFSSSPLGSDGKGRCSSNLIVTAFGDAGSGS